MRLTLIFLLAATLLFGQKATNREWTIFQKGVKDYKAGNYEAALKDFQLVLTKIKNEDNNLLTAHRLMLAKTLYKKGDYQASLDECKRFAQEFPESRYNQHINYVKANNYFRLDRLQTAVQTWLKVAESKEDARLAKKALLQAEQAVRFRLDEQGLQYLRTESKSAFAKQFVLYIQAERDYQAGNFPAALAALDQCMALNGGNNIIETKAKKLQAYLSDKKTNAIRIAALLPFSGANAEIGQALFDGAQLAIEKFNRENGPTIELIAFDYETRLSTALQRMKEITRDPSISAVFGPIENDISAACAVLADYEDIPLITPTASEKELRTLSSHIIQLAIPMDITIQKLARYAQDSLRIRRFATMSPIDDYFVRMTGTFVEKQQQLGNEVVAQEWYYPGDGDIKPRFEAIKRIGFKLEFQDSVLLEQPDLKQKSIDSLYSAYLKAMKEYNEESKIDVDSTDIPVSTIDGFFMPVFSEDISFVASNFAWGYFKTQVLGNSDWYDLEALKKNQSYVNGMIFVSDGYLNNEGWDFRKFRNDFRTSYKRTPEKYEILGFDSFSFILSALNGAPKTITRDDFFERMQNAPLFNGIYRNYEVGKKRFNDAVRILKFTYGQILPLH